MSGAKPKTQIEIRVSCNKLKDADIRLRSKSDPFCVMYMKTNDDWTEVKAASLFLSVGIFSRK